MAVGDGPRADVICGQASIVCPLAGDAAAETSPPICLPTSGCVFYPVYPGKGR